MKKFAGMMLRSAEPPKGVHMKSLSRIGLLVAMTMALIFSSPARGEKFSADKPEDQLSFQQKTIQAQMQELQERMFHRAELTREMEPGDSAKLIMAVRKARE